MTTALVPVSRGSRRCLADRRGSVLLTAMLLAVVIAIGLGGYITLSRTALKLAQRTFLANDASNLAEVGLEEAVFCFNTMAAGTAPATAWAGWTTSGANAMRTLSPFNRGQNAVGIVKVYVKGHDGSDAAPVVYSQATITLFDGGGPIVKTLQLSLEGGTANFSLVALNGLTLNNSAFVDSFNSNPTGSPTGPWLAYSAAIQASAAKVAVLAGSVSIKNKIRGDLYLGPGVVAPAANTCTGTIRTNFTASFPMPAYPTSSGVSQSYDVGSSLPATLPRAGDLPASDGRFYYFCHDTNIGSGMTTVAAGTNVTIVGTGLTMQISSPASGLTLQSGSSCHVYMDGPLALSGEVRLNADAGGWAGALHIYTTTNQACAVDDKCQLVAWFQAPNAPLVGTGGNPANMLVGYFLANTVSLSGNVDCHYDETLGSDGWRVNQWLERQSADDRSALAALTDNFLP